MGDAYVRDEFRRHKDSAPQYVPAFVAEWTQYKQTLMQMDKDQVLADAAPKPLVQTQDLLESLSDSQVGMLLVGFACVDVRYRAPQ
jgi:hypothetical protein